MRDLLEDKLCDFSRPDNRNYKESNTAREKIGKHNNRSQSIENVFLIYSYETLQTFLDRSADDAT